MTVSWYFLLSLSIVVTTDDLPADASAPPFATTLRMEDGASNALISVLTSRRRSSPEARHWAETFKPTSWRGVACDVPDPEVPELPVEA